MNQLENILNRIDQLQQEIEKSGNLTPELAKRINYKFRLDWNYYSNIMEGNTLTKLETKQVMMDNVTINGKPFKDVAEMRGHDKEVLDIFKIGKGEVRISESRIKEMHKTIMHEDDPENKKLIGKWKTDDNYVLNYKNERIDFLPHAEVPDEIHKLLNETNAEIDAFYHKKKQSKHPALIAFDFHLRYLSIHPFYDGNGRTGRLLLNLLLISFGYPPIILSSKSRDSYNKTLTEIQGYGANPEDLYVMLGELLTQSQQLTIDAIAGKNIEDEDDIDKEITLWKAKLDADENEVIERSEEVVKRIYSQSIRQIFTQFISKMKQFDELFLSVEYSNVLGNQGAICNELEYFEQWVNGELEDNTHGTEDRITLSVRHKAFKKNGNNPFDTSTSLSFLFKRYNYGLEDKKGRINQAYTKLYSENYTKDEASEIVTENIKQFFDYLKDLKKSK
jgi:Fic family protein